MILILGYFVWWFVTIGDFFLFLYCLRTQLNNCFWKIWWPCKEPENFQLNADAGQTLSWCHLLLLISAVIWAGSGLCQEGLGCLRLM